MSRYGANYPIDRYLNVQSAYDPGIAADGRTLVFLSNITGVPQVWRGEIPPPEGKLAWPDQMTFDSERVVGITVAPVGAESPMQAIFSRDTGGNENLQLFRLDLETGAEIPLTVGHDDAMHIFGGWSHDGRRVVFAANRRDRALFDLYVQDIDGDEATLVYQNDEPGYLFGATFSPDGTRIATTHNISGFNVRVLEIDIAARTGRVISPDDPGEGVRYSNMQFTPDGESLLLITDYGTDFLHIARLDPATRQIEPLVQPDWNVEGIKLSPDGRLLVYAVNVEGSSQIALLEMDSGRIRVLPAFDNEPGQFILTGFHFAPGSDAVAFTYSRATYTMNAYLWRFTDDSVTQLTRVAHGGLPVETFRAPELIHYPTFDTDPATGETRQIPAWFYRPQGDDPAPVIVIVHGGPESQARPAFAGLIQYFLHNGYALLVPNVRGSTGYGKAYSHLDDVEKRMDSVADLAHAAHWLKAQPQIDGDKIVVYGGSYGGFMVLAGMTHYPDLWAAGVDIVGVSNFVTFLQNTSAYRRGHREAEYGSLEHDRAFMERIAPANHLDKIQAPLMVIHGANDPRVPLSEAEQIVATLRSRDIPVEFLVFDDEGHGLVKLKNRLVAYPAVVAFLDKVIGG